MIFLYIYIYIKDRWSVIAAIFNDVCQRGATHLQHGWAYVSNSFVVNTPSTWFLYSCYLLYLAYKPTSTHFLLILEGEAYGVSTNTNICKRLPELSNSFTVIVDTFTVLMMFSYCIFKYVYWANKKIEKYNDKLQTIKDRRKFYENKTYLYSQVTSFYKLYHVSNKYR